MLTTEWVLAEFGDAYCDPADRADFISLYRGLTKNARVKIIPADTALFQRGVEDFFYFAEPLQFSRLHGRSLHAGRSLWPSQAREKRRLRSTVLRETSRISAVSSTVQPRK